MIMLIDSILSKLGLSEISANEEKGASRRRHVRHSGVQAEVQVADRSFSVRDWSMGGLFFETPPDARLVVGDRLNLSVRFRLPHETITITQTARVVRTATRGIAAEFLSMTPDIRRKFDRVLDSLHAQTFLESQVA